MYSRLGIHKILGDIMPVEDLARKGLAAAKIVGAVSSGGAGGFSLDPETAIALGELAADIGISLWDRWERHDAKSKQHAFENQPILDRMVQAGYSVNGIQNGGDLPRGLTMPRVQGKKGNGYAHNVQPGANPVPLIWFTPDGKPYLSVKPFGPTGDESFDEQIKSNAVPGKGWWADTDYKGLHDLNKAFYEGQSIPPNQSLVSVYPSLYKIDPITNKIQQTGNPKDYSPVLQYDKTGKLQTMEPALPGPQQATNGQKQLEDLVNGKVSPNADNNVPNWRDLLPPTIERLKEDPGKISSAFNPIAEFARGNYQKYTEPALLESIPSGSDAYRDIKQTGRREMEEGLTRQGIGFSQSQRAADQAWLNSLLDREERRPILDRPAGPQGYGMTMEEGNEAIGQGQGPARRDNTDLSKAFAKELQKLLLPDSPEQAQNQQKTHNVGGQGVNVPSPQQYTGAQNFFGSAMGKLGSYAAGRGADWLQRQATGRY